jgi:Holliday junction resolvasome RuvABC DNA-binding subunit
MIDKTRMIDNPVIDGLIDNSLEGEEKDSELCQDTSSIDRIEEKVTIQTLDEIQLNQLKSGLIGLGFQKSAVNQFIKSVEHKNETLEKLVAEGVNALSKGYTK